MTMLSAKSVVHLKIYPKKDQNGTSYKPYRLFFKLFHLQAVGDSIINVIFIASCHQVFPIKLSSLANLSKKQAGYKYEFNYFIIFSYKYERRIIYLPRAFFYCTDFKVDFLNTKLQQICRRMNAN